MLFYGPRSKGHMFDKCGLCGDCISTAISVLGMETEFSHYIMARDLAGRVFDLQIY